MAHSIVILENPQTGEIRQAPIGFSWTTLFFGGFVPLHRGDVDGYGQWWLIAVITLFTSWLVMPFTYNAIYIGRLRKQGFWEVDAARCNLNLQRHLSLHASRHSFLHLLKW